LNTEVIYSPPGTGNTRYLMDRLAELQGEVHPERVCLVSFSKAAAQVLSQRAEIECGHAGTLHSLAFKALGLDRDQVFNADRLVRFGKEIKLPITGSATNEGNSLTQGDIYLGIYSQARQYPKNRREPVISKALARCTGNRGTYDYFADSYEIHKEEWGLVDFHDMLTRACRTAYDYDFDLVMLDEAQDLTPTQWRYFRRIVKGAERVYVAGDDDQAIYQWAGADPAGMMKYAAETTAKETVLSQSYRVPGIVHKKAQALIRMIKDRKEKEYLPRGERGEFYAAGLMAPAMLHPGTLILYRNHYVAGSIKSDLHAAGVPYVYDSGKKSWYNDKYADCWAVLKRAATGQRMELTKREGISWRKIYGDLDPMDVDEGNAGIYLGKLPIMHVAYLRKVESQPPMEPVRLSTIHGAKGKEADHVILINGRSFRTAQGPLDAELRVFYVGMTRARRTLAVVDDANPLQEVRIIYSK